MALASLLYFSERDSPGLFIGQVIGASFFSQRQHDATARNGLAVLWKFKLHHYLESGCVSPSPHSSAGTKQSPTQLLRELQWPLVQ
jgi:hypothetical protein